MSFHEYPNLYVEHITLKVKDLEKMISFYKEIIGFQILEQTDSKAALSADGKTALLHLEKLEEAEDKRRRTTGLYHFALLVPTREDLGAQLQHLLESGYPLQGASDHNVSEALYLGDPEGNGIEIYRDRAADEWAWDGEFVKMDTLQMDAQGVLDSGSQLQWNGLPKETKMGHIHLHVAELAETADFYVKGLGFDIVQKYGTQAFFISTGKYHHHIGLNTWNGVGAPAPKETNPGMKYFDLKVPSHAAREEIAARLTDMNAEVKQDNNAYYVKDPSGNTIRLVL
ncbi:VOC family protein [Niallia circulans]|uniref:VOC family protein n=1 Tax=Niallia circulans TaxID=1397 RepID=A0A553SGI4_NIACI|nr:VOC family protein [Niallia circulans]TRZ36102.1 VOC family protein [Niallia circulans]